LIREELLFRLSFIFVVRIRIVVVLVVVLVVVEQCGRVDDVILK
jgi:hypothetical protein